MIGIGIPISQRIIGMRASVVCSYVTFGRFFGSLLLCEVRKIPDIFRCERFPIAGTAHERSIMGMRLVPL